MMKMITKRITNKEGKIEKVKWNKQKKNSEKRNIKKF